MVKKSIRSEALELVKAHCEFDPQTFLIIFFQPKDEEVVRLLEVSEDVPVSGCLFPISFAPDKEDGMKYPCTVIVVAREDYEKIKQGKIKLPRDWGKIEDGEAIFRKEEVAL